MKLHADASVKGQFVRALRARGFSVSTQFEIDPKAADPSVLQSVNSAEAVLLTEDKDFGELVFRDRLHTRGVVLVRVGVVNAAALEAVLTHIVAALPDAEGAFTTITASGVRRRVFTLS